MLADYQKLCQKSGSYVDIPMENATFEEYYKVGFSFIIWLVIVVNSHSNYGNVQAQCIFSDEEWAANIEILKTGLPTNFRFTGSKSNASKILDLMKKNYFPSMSNVQDDNGVKIPPPEPLPWYPNNFGWQYLATRSQIRNHEGIKKFHEFLMAETDCGNVSRQEAVSMIPPLFLGAQPGHYVLDMCAAPGSKTAQLIEAVTSNDELLPTNKTGGLVVANDADYKRAYMLVKQSKRLQCPNLVVTNHEAQFFPYIYFKSKEESSSAEERILQFDRILCDVPCCGDGTLRKNRAIWKNWHQTNGNTLNKLQLAILIRAIHFLKVGGRVVYSTCTFNPVENEAVVAAALNLCGDAVALRDVSDQLPGLKRRPGISSWKVMDPDGKLHDKIETVDAKYQHKKVFTDCFAPENAAELNLNRCMRIVPTDQDTGAFFVAVFEKVKPFGGLDDKIVAKESGVTEKRKVDGVEDPAENDPKRAHIDCEETDVDKPAKTAAWVGKGEEPFIFVSEDNKEVAEIVKFYGINSTFPKDQFVVRSENESYKSLYFVSLSVKKLLNAKNSSKLKIVNTGVRTFTKTSQYGGQKDAFLYRLTSEGLSTIAPFLSSKRVIEIDRADVQKLLEKEYPLLTEMTPAFQNKIASFEAGSFVAKYTPDENADAGSLHEQVPLPAMRASVSVSLLVPKEERKSLQSRIFGAHFEYEKGLDKDRKNEKEDNNSAEDGKDDVDTTENAVDE
ncbi:tRNA (cytosine(34)-C(5))-methyltransferase [Physocladia obscura]|uniref:tRNA (Cytosine(34)-C(5))-methyltransferase n=1 Tax=Physocladia obscura TaxID=109957 RepID=A0AAD5XD99_9FUNG|nr:tRNA (cytosine(34)-C(5))-methyltransferase [Physocladia obscura]